MWNEPEAKSGHRFDLFAVLKNFVDLQKIYVNLIGAQRNVSLESAMRLLHMDFKGQVHSALSDSYNTGRIFHKICCSDGLDYELDYINPGREQKKEMAEKERKLNQENYGCSLGAFVSPELLAWFGLNKTADATEKKESFENNGIELVPDITESIDNSFLSQIVDKEEIVRLCGKYKIGIRNWVDFAEKVVRTGDMMAA